MLSNLRAWLAYVAYKWRPKWLDQHKWSLALEILVGWNCNWIESRDDAISTLKLIAFDNIIGWVAIAS